MHVAQKLMKTVADPGPLPFSGRFFFFFFFARHPGGRSGRRMVPLYTIMLMTAKKCKGKNVLDSPPPPPPPQLSDFFRPGAASRNFRPSLFRNPGSATGKSFTKARSVFKSIAISQAGLQLPLSAHAQIVTVNWLIEGVSAIKC